MEDQNMEFSIEKSELLTALYRAQGVVERRTAMPILANILLEAKKSIIVITATDLEVGVRGSYPAVIEKEGSITMPARHLYDIAKELPEGKIYFKRKENFWVEIVSGKALFNIVGLSPEDYPALPNYKDKKFYDIKPEILKEMIQKTIFSVSTDETRYHLNGVFFEKPKPGENTIRMVATDGHRLSLIDKQIEFSEELSFTRGVIIPRKGLVELKRLLEEGESEYQIGFDSNHVVIKKEKVIIFIRLIDGEFPDYEQVIPQNHTKKVILNKEKFLGSLRRISLLSNDRSKAIKLCLKDDILEISTNNPEIGEAKEELDISYKGSDLEAGFNAKYFMDVLNAIESEEVSLEFNDKLSPGVIRSVGDDKYVCVVMPMRI